MKIDDVNWQKAGRENIVQFSWFNFYKYFFVYLPHADILLKYVRKFLKQIEHLFKHGKYKYYVKKSVFCPKYSKKQLKMGAFYYIT